jgi:hypothetical protein
VVDDHTLVRKLEARLECNLFDHVEDDAILEISIEQELLRVCMLKMCKMILEICLWHGLYLVIVDGDARLQRTMLAPLRNSSP